MEYLSYHFTFFQVQRDIYIIIQQQWIYCLGQYVFNLICTASDPLASSSWKGRWDASIIMFVISWRCLQNRMLWSHQYKTKASSVLAYLSEDLQHRSIPLHVADYLLDVVHCFHWIKEAFIECSMVLIIRPHKRKDVGGQNQKNSDIVGHIPWESSLVFWYFLEKSGSKTTCREGLGSSMCTYG